MFKIAGDAQRGDCGLQHEFQHRLPTGPNSFFRKMPKYFRGAVLSRKWLDKNLLSFKNNFPPEASCGLAVAAAQVLCDQTVRARASPVVATGRSCENRHAGVVCLCGHLSSPCAWAPVWFSAVTALECVWVEFPGKTNAVSCKNSSNLECSPVSMCT